ncbi:hypothetical protein SAMN04488508_10612 [Aquimarina spongiae]|uniref:Uncharacterized protein n=1 Tax=Aquimarina spongiae TaxID=570521 RepID=A0A1M6H1F4_9FLAO|nr:hypothetical protein SAMN04488508_10612 [Aquimarina spongiae]
MPLWQQAYQTTFYLVNPYFFVYSPHKNVHKRTPLFVNDHIQLLSIYVNIDTI